MQPYKVSIQKDYFYQFSTATGDSYACYFLSYKDYFRHYPLIADHVFSFNIDLIRKSGIKAEKDARLPITIVKILRDFLSEWQNAVVYICDSSDERHILRKRKFNAWFKQNDDGSIIKIDAELNIEGMEIFNTILVHKDNILKNIFIEAFLDFNRTNETK